MVPKNRGGKAQECPSSGLEGPVGLGGRWVGTGGAEGTEAERWCRLGKAAPPGQNVPKSHTHSLQLPKVLFSMHQDAPPNPLQPVPCLGGPADGHPLGLGLRPLFLPQGPWCVHGMSWSPYLVGAYAPRFVWPRGGGFAFP